MGASSSKSQAMLWPIDPARILARAFPRPDLRTAALVLALAIVGSAPAQGEVDLTIAPTREIPDGKLTTRRSPTCRPSAATTRSRSCGGLPARRR